jgi:hypothetical protein
MNRRRISGLFGERHQNRAPLFELAGDFAAGERCLKVGENLFYAAFGHSRCRGTEEQIDQHGHRHGHHNHHPQPQGQSSEGFRSRHLVDHRLHRHDYEAGEEGNGPEREGASAEHRQEGHQRHRGQADCRIAQGDLRETQRENDAEGDGEASSHDHPRSPRYVVLAGQEHHICHVRGKGYAKHHRNCNRDGAARCDTRDGEPAAFSWRKLLRKEREKRCAALRAFIDSRHDEL